MPLDSIGHTQKLFARVDAEITAFIALLAEIARNPSHLSDLNTRAVQELALMAAAAKEIGGKLYEDVELLRRDYHRFLTHPESLQKIQQDALRIKHEVRAL